MNQERTVSVPENSVGCESDRQIPVEGIQVEGAGKSATSGFIRAKEYDPTLSTIAAHTVVALGSDFFSSLVRHLATALGVRYAFVTECLDDENRVRSLAF